MKWPLNNKGLFNLWGLDPGAPFDIHKNTDSLKPPALPAAPSIDNAQSTALDAQTKQRQSALAAGGQTNVTGGTGIILGQDVQSATLVGSN